jgi:hypothetical protein
MLLGCVIGWDHKLHQDLSLLAKFQITQGSLGIFPGGSFGCVKSTTDFEEFCRRTLGQAKFELDVLM